ncbi:hypothetical protein NFI96_019751 [Prochilodus magdalenae]|nr:hypothetical protein NFI96_019751 [Prochilodus magdalenae]
MLLQLKPLQWDNTRDIKGHQPDVKRPQSRLMKASGDFRCFMHIAAYKVPKLIENVRGKPTTAPYRLLQGYVSGYLAMLSGHCPVVLCNMTQTNLQEAETDDQDRTLPHKADRLRALAEVSTLFGRQECPYVFQWKGQQSPGTEHDAA